MRPLAPLLATLLLCGCATQRGDRLALQTVTIPTPVRCHPDVGDNPDYPDTDDALEGAPDLFARVQRLTAGRLLRQARERELQAALAACEGP